MSTKRTLLVQLDTDPQPSLFDRIVAYDAGAEEVLSYGQVTLSQVQALVHGAIFTRGPKDLHRTALYVGGSQVAEAEKLFSEAGKHLIPAYDLSVSMMLDPNGSNTTAAAAVRCARQHMELSGGTAMVLGAGPVGRRVARLLAGLQCRVHLIDVNAACLEEAARQIKERQPAAEVTTQSAGALTPPAPPQLLVAAGPSGKQLLTQTQREVFPDLKIIIDLNAVPPTGIEGVEVMDVGTNRQGIACYGALGVGNLKMKIHKAAIASLFTANTRRLDLEEMYELLASV